MSAIVETYLNGVLVTRKDPYTTPRVVTTYTVTGTVASTRPYTADENTTADAVIAAELSDANKASIETALSDALGTLQNVIDTPNATINASPAPYIKDLARVQRRAIRLLIRRLDGVA